MGDSYPIPDVNPDPRCPSGGDLGWCVFPSDNSFWCYEQSWLLGLWYYCNRYDSIKVDDGPPEKWCIYELQPVDCWWYYGYITITYYTNFLFSSSGPFTNRDASSRASILANLHNLYPGLPGKCEHWKLDDMEHSVVRLASWYDRSCVYIKIKESEFSF